MKTNVMNQDALVESDSRQQSISAECCATLQIDPQPLTSDIDDRLQFEMLLTELSATFVNIPADQVDSRIELALGKIVDFLGVDRSSLGEFSEDRKQLHVTHSYVLPGFQPFPRILMDDQFPWYTDQLRQGNVLRYSRLPDDLPAEALAERTYSLQAGFKANLSIPLCVGGVPIAVLAFGSFRVYRDWPDELVRRLQLLGEILGNALSRKRSEEKAHSLREQLSRVSRVTTVGELAVTIAHEINQPLCAIVSNAQAAQHILASDQLDLDELGEALKDIVSDSRRASEVVRRIRGLVQKEQRDLAIFDLNQAIQEVVSLLTLELSRGGVELSLDLAADLPRIHGDPVQLQQVMLNLLVNANEAMKMAGSHHPRLSIHSRCIHGEAVVCVQDTGPGVSLEHRDHIFDALFTTKPGGMGVGLAISRSMIEGHGGRLWLEPKSEGGACFCFSLPPAGKSGGDD